MNNIAVECPVCSKTFLSKNIEKHAQFCIEKNNQISHSSKRQLKRKFETSDLMQEQQVSPWSKFHNNVQVDVNVTKSTATSSVLTAKHINTDLGLPQKNNCIFPSFSFAKPLSDLARPSSLKGYVGQTNVVGPHSALFKLLQENLIPSMIFWGPPGCGKTTLANIIAMNVKNNKSEKKLFFIKLSATDSGKAELQATIKTAFNKQQMFSSQTVLFIDEVHRYNKLQQDSLLPAIENGTIILIGATTENPSFVLNSALLSRCRVVVMEKLEVPQVKLILQQTMSNFLPSLKLINYDNKQKLVGKTEQDIFIDEKSIDVLASLCDGDARTALNGLQSALQTVISTNGRNIVDVDLVKECLQQSSVLYDRKGDQHYDITSALHKSIRGGDDNAALYWLSRMILGGEDPRFIARRLIRVASEDIGLADPHALNQAVSCYHACLYVGMPECDVSLAQCVVYLARAPKSVEIYKGLEKAKQCIKENKGPLPAVPLHLRNAPTKLMKSLGYGKDYKYNPEDAIGQTYLPEQLLDVKFLS